MEKMGVGLDRVFKILVMLLNDGLLVVVVVFVICMLNLKVLVKVFFVKKVVMVELVLVEWMMGYIFGGVSFFG